MAEPVSLEQWEARIREVSLDLDAETMRRAGYRVVDYLVKRLAEIRSSKLGRELTREETEELLREPMPEEPTDFDTVFDEYTRKVAAKEGIRL